MENNKQDNPIDWLSNQFYQLLEQYSEGNFDRTTFNELMLYDTYTARKMYQEKIEQAELDAKEIVIIKQCAEKSTSEANKYAEGYKEGYQRALDYITDTIKNKIEIKRDGNNIFTTTGTNTTFLCTQFISDKSKGANLPRCIQCGKPQYQHPIITNTI